MHSTIEFLLHAPAPQNPPDPEREVEVTVQINGQDLLPHSGGSIVFDAISVLVQGAETADFSPYTCSCGVPDCAGIDEDAQLLANNRSVCWTFPEAPFRKRLNAELFPPDQPLTLYFGRKQYEQALALLQAELEALHGEDSLGLSVVPCSMPPEFEAGVPVFVYLARYRQRFEQDQAHQRAVAEAEGDLRQWLVRAQLTGEVSVSASLASVAWTQVRHFEEQTDALAHLARVVRPALLKDPAPTCRQVPTDERMVLFRLDQHPPGFHLTKAWFAERWDDAVFSLVPETSA